MLFLKFVLPALAILIGSSAAPANVEHAGLITSSNAGLARSSDMAATEVNKSLDVGRIPSTLTKKRAEASIFISITYMDTAGFKITRNYDIVPDICVPFATLFAFISITRLEVGTLNYKRAF
ncbi:hypothetical protein C8R44DRAFT_735878 [Mycena epipterygia]|nr:hypothetical protein C8R44DRAFT_735878 [Mycena epipterygia]